MQFEVVDAGPEDRKQGIYLIKDSWDDWFTYNTTYQLLVINASGKRSQIGPVKIGAFNMAPGERRPQLKPKFDRIGDRFFSLGQDDSYYQNLNSLGEEMRDRILNGLNDLAKNENLFLDALSENVTKISLLRYVTPASVRGQFRRLANGGARLSKYEFSYRSSKTSSDLSSNLSLSFQVEPGSNPPTNIHVLIGRNGVGKTHLLNNMINCLLEPSSSKYGKFKSIAGEALEGDIFANLVSVTFSAFDETKPQPERRDKTKGIQYSYIGLKRLTKLGQASTTKSPQVLANEFVKSVQSFTNPAKLSRWTRSLKILETDPIFKEASVAGVAAKFEDEDNFKVGALTLFKKLSSGHKIVLLSITRLVETVEERTLVLIDEPEAHLHPPLLAAFVRSLSDLLIDRNGVAIVATHSPVVLQEVPRRCVWKLRRSNTEAVADRLEIESFAENVGVLTREVFGLEVTNSGFHDLLRQAIEKEDEFDSVLSQFGGELGAEGKAIVRVLLHLKSIHGK